MKAIRGKKNFGDSKVHDVQSIISEKPVRVNVYRTMRDFTSTPTRSKVATFEARIDNFKQTFRDMKHNVTGDEMDVLFLMTTCWSTDINGDTIDFEKGDEVEVGAEKYLVTGKVSYPSWKHEGMLIQAK
jgi:mannose-6-phosphate isomerase class I